MKKNMKSLKTHPTSMTISRLTSIITFYTSVPKSVKVTPLSLNSVWTSVTGYLTGLVQRTWSYFLSIPFASSTSSLDAEYLYQLSITHNLDSMLSERIANLKKSIRKLRRLSMSSISLAWTTYHLMELQSQGSSSGQTTSSSQKPRKRGPALVNSFRASIANSVGRKRSAGRAVTSTTK